MGEKWTPIETELIMKAGGRSTTNMTLFQQLQKINPDRTYEAMKHKIRKLRKQGLYDQPRERMERKLKVGYLDIETTDLRADWGYMLSWCIKPKDSDKIEYDVIKKSEIVSRFTFDKRITKSLLEAMQKYDVLYAHYGRDYKFDLPYIRTRALVHGYEDLIPGKREAFIRDTHLIARSKLKLSRNSLAVIARTLNVTKAEKSPVTGEQWQKARVGHKPSLAYVLDHNKADVIILEEVHKRLEGIENKTFTSI